MKNKIKNNLFKLARWALGPAKKANKQYLLAKQMHTYNTWAVQHESECYIFDDSRQKPLISIVVPAYNTDPSHFLSMVFSVINQHYENWELVIVNASDIPKLKQKITNSSNIDTRIKVVDPGRNLGIASNTNFGIKHCTGEYIAFLDHDDLLQTCALHSVARVIEETGAGIIYSDEDKIKDDSSLYFEPFFKPFWSPDLFENVNYINHFTVVKAAHIEKVKGLRPKFDGAQDYDLLLRVIDICEPKIEHIARVLYHWRAAQTSTANDFSSKSYVLKAGEQALKEHLDRQGIKGTAQAIKGYPGFYETLPAAPKKISIVVGPVDLPSRRLCIAWLEELSQKLDETMQAELIIGAWLKAHKLAKFDTVRYVDSPSGKNYWHEAAEAVTGSAVLCFSAAALPSSKQAISKLAAQASTAKAIVAPFILSEDGTILDAGLVESEHGKQRLFTGCKLGDNTYYGFTGWVRNVAGLTLDVFATSRDNFVSLVRHVDGPALTDVELQAFMDAPNQPRLLVNPLAAFVYKGKFAQDSLRSEQYFNPQLTQAHTDLYIKVDNWGKLKELSERDNAQ